MGRAIVIHDVDFSSLNLGKVFTGDTVLITSLEIDAEDSYVGSSFTASVLYTPANTLMTDITWSITSGNEYATVNQNGTVSIAAGAQNAQIVLRATSVYVPSVYAEKTISVSRVQLRNSISISSDYFYTGILPSSISSSLIVEITAKIDSLSRTSEYLKRATLLGWNYGGQLACRLNSGMDSADIFEAAEKFKLEDGSNWGPEGYYDVGTTYTFKKDVNLTTSKASCYVDGTKLFERACGSMIANANNTQLPIMGDYYPAGGSADSNGITAQGGITIERVKIWIDGALVRDYNPAYDGENYGLYDTVNSEFITSVRGTTTSLNGNVR